MYEDYWGLREKPFENTPDSRFLYRSRKHEEALMRMFYAIRERKGAAMFTGEYGSGKTVLARVLLEDLTEKPQRYSVALIVYPNFSSKDLLREILFQLDGSDYKETKIRLLHILNDKLYKNLNEDRDTVVIIDEAQVIAKREVLEELRLLLNFQLRDRFLLTLLLVGQPELRERINEIEQLEQRLAVRYHLDTLDEEETKGYIHHRCQVAGRKNPIFSNEATRLIYNASSGIPRKINNFCDMSLVVGMMEKLEKIEEGIMEKVIEDFVLDKVKSI